LALIVYLHYKIYNLLIFKYLTCMYCNWICILLYILALQSTGMNKYLNSITFLVRHTFLLNHKHIDILWHYIFVWNYSPVENKVLNILTYYNFIFLFIIEKHTFSFMIQSHLHFTCCSTVIIFFSLKVNVSLYCRMVTCGKQI